MNRIVVAAFLAALVSCSPSQPPPKTASDNVSVTSAPPPSPAPAARSDQQLNLSAEIRAKCGIDDSNRAPKFDFDSSQLA
jgi:hypothetical protein